VRVWIERDRYIDRVRDRDAERERERERERDAEEKNVAIEMMYSSCRGTCVPLIHVQYVYARLRGAKARTRFWSSIAGESAGN
jgi:hypothetical protein